MFFLMRRQPPRSTRTNTLVPYPTLFRSLLDCIDLTVSGGGARLRGTDLSAPLTRREAIEARLDFVAWFERDPLLRERVRDTLKRLPDVERALGRVAAGRGGPRDPAQLRAGLEGAARSEEHTSELQSLMRISYAVFFLTKKNHATMR